MSSHLPVKRVEGETLEDRLTDNAFENILPERYLSAGETQEDLFERVAQNVAVAEAVHHDQSVTVYPECVKSDHPRRHELVEEVWGSRDDFEVSVNEEDEFTVTSEDGDMGIELTEDIAPKFDYDAVVQRAPNDVASQMSETASEFQELMEYLSFIPNSPTLMNAGDELQQLSACFVDSPGDDITDIHETAKEAAEIFQSGGGMGYAFWELRPYGDEVGSTDGIASGPITFMETYDQMCETIAQGGARRGAQMGIMRVSHPDVIEFIHSKDPDVSLAHSLRLNDPDDFTHHSFGEALEEARELLAPYTDEDGNVEKAPKEYRNAIEGHLSNFNISVGITNDFMEAVQNDEDFVFTNPRTDEPHIATRETREMYARYDLGDEVEVGEPLSISAREIWDRIISGAHQNGEPGTVFLERMNDDHSFDVQKYPEKRIKATNPCGEQPLMEYEACNLGHINLSTLISEDREMWQDFERENLKELNLDVAVENFLDQAINWDELDHRIELGTRFLENVVTMSDFPVDEIEETVRDHRKIGLGVMGLGEMLYQLGVRYGSDVGAEVAEQLATHINQKSKGVSSELAMERGVFNEWDKSKWADPTSYPEWFERMTGEDADDWDEGFPLRNHNTTTVAPTGTTSMVGNTSGGIEPVYSIANIKNVSDDVGLTIEYNDYFLRVLEANGINQEKVKEQAKEQMENNEFDGIPGLDLVPDAWEDIFVVTDDLDAEDHLKMQAAWQPGVDSAISKTVNAPHSQSLEDAKDTFMLGWELGAKGVTYYRDGSRTKQVKTTRMQNQEFAEDGDLVDAVKEAEDDIQTEIASVLLDEMDFERTTDEPWYENGHYAQMRENPTTLLACREKVPTGYGDTYVIISLDKQGRPFEMFLEKGDVGGYENAFVKSLAKTISVALRSGVDPEEVYSNLIGTKAPKTGFGGEEYKQVESIPDGFGRALKRVHEGEAEINGTPVREVVEMVGDSVQGMKIADGGTKSKTSHTETAADVEIDAGSDGAPSLDPGEDCWCDDPTDRRIIYNEGCKKCESCGWSQC
jgi:ribonucleoside-diphosphate reductase alpha chain